MITGTREDCRIADRVGYFADEMGWEKVVVDMHTLTGVIKRSAEETFFLFGHSMGSFLSRYYAMHYAAELTGLVLSGTAGDSGALRKIGIIVATMSKD